MRKIMAAALLMGFLGVGCSGKMPTAPTPPPIDLTGTWIGQVTVLGMTARMTWTLAQNGISVTGPATIGLSSGTVLLNGFLTGTLAGSTLTYVISIGPGGIPAQPACTGQIGGTMNATMGVPSTLAGTTAVTSSSCSPPLPGGNITLTRQ
jgi:hypothetical protein